MGTAGPRLPQALRGQRSSHTALASVRCWTEGERPKKKCHLKANCYRFMTFFGFKWKTIEQQSKCLFLSTSSPAFKAYIVLKKRTIQAQLKSCHYFFPPLFAYFWRLLLQKLHLRIPGTEASGLLSLENSKLFLCPVYLIDSQHLSGTQSISLSLPLHHSHFWQLNTRSKSSVTQTYDTVNLCNTATL